MCGRSRSPSACNVPSLSLSFLSLHYRYNFAVAASHFDFLFLFFCFQRGRGVGGSSVSSVVKESEESEEEESEEAPEEGGEEAPEAEAEAEATPAEAPATVEEMLIEGYNKVKEAACAYEKDEYQDHTLEMYMKENAALVAALAAKAMEEGYGEVKEMELTQEMYEAHCNEMKEAYGKKMDELKETYGAGKE